MITPQLITAIGVMITNVILAGWLVAMVIWYRKANAK